MFGIAIAFMDYRPGLGFTRSPWVGLENFRRLFSTVGLGQILWNTVFMSTMKIVAHLVVPVLFALLLNEVRVRWYKRLVQTLTYLPYFLSWVILGGIILEFLSPDGLVNNLIKMLGGKAVFFLGNETVFPYTMVVTDLWKEFGFLTIIYLAALTAIDPTLYEAATVDGAGRLKQTWHITLPGITPIIILMSVLSIGSIFSAGFDQIFNLYNPLVTKTGEIIDTYVYKQGLVNMKYSFSTAVGLLKSVISTILLVSSYRLAARISDYRVF